MPDGSKRNFSDENVILKDLLTLTKAATQRVEQLLQRAKVHCQSVICDDGRVDPVRLETHQLQAHGLAGHLYRIAASNAQLGRLSGG